MLLISNEEKAIAKLGKSDQFGLCDILRSVGPEYLGEIRAGLSIV